MLFVRRSEWGAPVSSAAAYIASTRGVKVHYLGTPYSSRTHDKCDDYVRAVRASHLANTAENYSDIAYNMLVCEHGYVFEGRGAHKRTGANGNATLNSQHYAVCALLGSSGLTQPTDAMLNGIRDAIEYLREHGDAGSEIKGHRDGYATSCPGQPLYNWVLKGAPRPGGTTPQPTLTTYTVLAGDTLSSIGRKLGIDWKLIAALNDLAEPYTIQVGQKLKTQTTAPAPAPTAPKYEPFPGASFFMNGSQPAIGKSSPIFTAMGKRLIAKGFGKYYSVGAGPKLGQADVNAYEAYQRSLGYTGAAAQWPPGPTSWNKLQVPNV